VLVACGIASAADLSLSAGGRLAVAAGGGCSLAAAGRLDVAAGESFSLPRDAAAAAGADLAVSARDVVLAGRVRAGGDLRIEANSTARLLAGGAAEAAGRAAVSAGRLVMAAGTFVAGDGGGVGVATAGDAAVCGLRSAASRVAVDVGGNATLLAGPGCAIRARGDVALAVAGALDAHTAAGGGNRTAGEGECDVESTGGDVGAAAGGAIRAGAGRWCAGGAVALRRCPAKAWGE
jgi:hypothetical protein